MAKNIFVQPDYDSIIERIGALTSENRRQWGKMNLAQMLSHCGLQLQLGLGMIDQQTFEGPSIMRTRFGRWFVLYAMPWTRNLRTPSKMNMLSNDVPLHDFKTAKKQLIDLLAEVQEGRDLRPHPFLGAMDKTDWGRLIWIHLDHHLRQFGG